VGYFGIVRIFSPPSFCFYGFIIATEMYIQATHPTNKDKTSQPTICEDKIGSAALVGCVLGFLRYGVHALEASKEKRGILGVSFVGRAQLTPWSRLTAQDPQRKRD